MILLSLSWCSDHTVRSQQTIINKETRTNEQ